MRTKLLMALALMVVSELGLQAQMTPTSAATGTGDVAIVAAMPSGRTQLYFCGFSSHETVGSASATTSVYAGTDATGRLLFTFSLTANESRSEGPWAPDQCLPTSEGVFVDRGGTGSTIITVYTRTGM